LSAVEHHQLDDAGVRSVRVTEKNRPQAIGLGAEQSRPVAGECLVEKLDETQPVAPETHRPFGVGGDYRRVVDPGHAVPPVWGRAIAG